VSNEPLVWKNEAIGDACEAKTTHKYTLYTELCFVGRIQPHGRWVLG